MGRLQPVRGPRSRRPHPAFSGSLPRPTVAPSDASDVTPVEPEPSVQDVLRPTEATPGGVDNIPVEALPENERAAEAFDYERLDQDVDAGRQ